MQRTKSDADEGKINKRAFVVCYSVPRCFHARAKTKKKNTDRKMAKSAPTSGKEDPIEEISRHGERKRKFAPTTSLFGAFLRSKITVESGFGFCALLLALACSFLIGFCSCSSASVAIFSFASV